MVVVIINFPPIKEGKDADFLEWFTSTNKKIANAKGFICRRLLKPTKGGNYAAIVEHETQETFLAMHNSPAHDEASKGLGPLLDGKPSPQFFEVIVE